LALAWAIDKPVERIPRPRRQHRFGILGGKLLGFGRVVHRAELRTAHGAEGGVLEALLGQRFIVHSLGGFRIERQLELLAPIEAIAGAGEFIVAIPRAGPVRAISAACAAIL
jgi:hypothetical protein